MDSRYVIDDPSDLLSPSLLIFRDLVRKNLGRHDRYGQRSRPATASCQDSQDGRDRQDGDDAGHLQAQDGHHCGGGDGGRGRRDRRLACLSSGGAEPEPLCAPGPELSRDDLSGPRRPPRLGAGTCRRRCASRSARCPCWSISMSAWAGRESTPASRPRHSMH